MTVEGEQERDHVVEHVQQERHRSSPGRAASAVRVASGSEDPERATSPERPKRRTSIAKYKLRILHETDEALASGAGEGAVARCCAVRSVLVAPDLVAA
jgi:hypothetical protein